MYRKFAVPLPAATTALLDLAFARGLELCDTGGGFLFRITLRNGATFEGAPEACAADEVGHAMALMSGEYIVTHEIAAISVIPLE